MRGKVSDALAFFKKNFPLTGTNMTYFAIRLSSTIGGNREMDQLYTTSQMSNITRKTKFSHIC